MSLIREFAIRNKLLYSGFVLPNVQIFYVQKISFATFGVIIDDFFTRYAGLGYSLIGAITSKAYQDNIKSDIKLQYECTIPQAFNKITHLAIA